MQQAAQTIASFRDGVCPVLLDRTIGIAASQTFAMHDAMEARRLLPHEPSNR